LNVHRTSVYLLIVTVIGLIALGLVMMSSTSAYAPESHGDATFLLRRQAEWLALGVFVFAVAAALDYHLLQKTWWIWFALSIALLALCYFPHFCHRINGSRRWIQLGALRFQPSEFAKLAAVSAVAWVLSRGEAHPRQFLRGFVAPLGLAGILLAFIAPEVDLGCTALIAATTLILMFIAGTRLFYLVPMMAAGAIGGFVAMMKMPDRVGRILAYLHPDKYPAEAFQGLQGLIALGSGGVEGLGLGNGRQKMSYLPFAHTDFIFPVIGEELGLRCTLAVVFAYILFVLCGAVIAMRARDRFGMLLGFGVTVIIALQAAINIGVTTTLLPNKGLPLPFISYGGTNLVFCLMGVGILVNIYRNGVTDKEEKSGGVVLNARVRKPLRMVRL
jgi:cell division protein FtsW